MSQAEHTSPPPVIPASKVAMVGPVRSVPAAVLASLAWLGVLGVQLVLEPKIEQYFADFGAALPRVTLSAIHNARWLQGRTLGASFPMWPAAVLALAVLIGVLATTGASRRGPRVTLWLLFALGVLVLLMLAAAYGLPLMAMKASLAEN
jgi:hypothetical protein